MELQILSHCAGKGIVDQKLAVAVSRLTLAEKHFNRLQYRMLVKLYEEYPIKEVLEAICALLIKGECRMAEAFAWYEKGVKAGISLTRLYEYYLYALPGNYCYLLPKEVLLYFSYGGNELDLHSRAVLYKNVLVYLEPIDPLYQAYERTIEKFATEQLFESRIDKQLAGIYERMILKDVIDLPMAKVLPSILRSYRVECSNKKMKYVVVCYEEMTEEDAFLLDNGVAMCPCFRNTAYCFSRMLLATGMLPFPIKRSRSWTARSWKSAALKCIRSIPCSGFGHVKGFWLTEPRIWKK